MITKNMTDKEIYDEVIADFENIVKVSRAKNEKVHKILRRSVLFPARVHSYVTSVRKNNWLLCWEAKDKKEVNDPSSRYVCYRDSPHGKYVYQVSYKKGEPFLSVYTPHFFSRFAERKKINLTGLELIKRYVERNHDGHFLYKDEDVDTEKQFIDNIYVVNVDGIAIGEKVAGTNIILHITFITFEMAKGDQKLLELFLKHESILGKGSVIRLS